MRYSAWPENYLWRPLPKQSKNEKHRQKAVFFVWLRLTDSKRILILREQSEQAKSAGND